MAIIPGPPPRQGDQLDGAPPRATPELNGALPRATTLDNGNGRAAVDPAAVDESGSDTRRSKGGIEGLIGKRVAAATEHALDGPNQRLMRAQRPVWDAICKYYFRLETSGWERLPEETSLLIGNHSGGSLTMDAWTFVADWWQRFETERLLHATAHDVLMAAPGLGDYFRQVGVIPASRQGVSAALSAGCDVIIWPGGEVDAMRNWRRRDEAVLGGRTGFVRTAIRSGVPIVPVASVGGHDTVFVLSEGRWVANGLENIPGLKGLKEKLRGSQLPIVLGIPFGLTIESVPTHLPLPAKIRTELLEPIHVDKDPERVNDREYVESIYREVESAIQRRNEPTRQETALPDLRLVSCALSSWDKYGMLWYAANWTSEAVLELTDEERDAVGAVGASAEVLAGVGVAFADRVGVRGGVREQGCRGGVWGVAADGREVASAVLRAASGRVG